jgi:hypothetical protein
MTDREKAYSRYIYLKRYLFELAQECQALAGSIHEETEFNFTEKDFSNVDCDKVISLAKELKLRQDDFKKKSAEFTRLTDTYKFTE